MKNKKQESFKEKILQGFYRLPGIFHRSPFEGLRLHYFCGKTVLKWSLFKSAR